MLSRLYTMGKRVGSYIQELRHQQGVSIRQLGDQIGLSPAHLSLLERGQREISINALYPLIRALQGDFANAVHLFTLDAGVPEEAWAQQPTHTPT